MAGEFGKDLRHNGCGERVQNSFDFVMQVSIWASRSWEAAIILVVSALLESAR
jgi:hypothetical protein